MEALLENLKIVTENGRRVVEVALKDVLTLALQRSTSLKAERIGEEIAQSTLLAARERNNPTLTSSLDQSRSLSFGLIPNRSRTLTLSSEFSKKLSSGIRYELKFTELQFKSEGINDAGNFSGSSSTGNTSALKSSVTIPIFQDFGSELGDIPVRQAEIGLRRSRLTTRRNESDLLRLVATVYWDLVGLLEAVHVQEESVKLSEQLLRDNQERLRAGVLSPADVKVTETQLARDRQTLLSLQLDALRIEDEVRAALSLENLDIGFRPVDSPALRKPEADLERLLERVFENDPALAILSTSLEGNRYDLIQARNREDTDLDLELFYQFNGCDRQFDENGIFLECDNKLLAGVSDFTDFNFGGYGLNLTWTVPLFDNQAAEAVRRRLLERSQIELRLQDLRTILSVRLQSVLRTLRLAQRQVEVAQISVALQQELLQNEIERLKLGRSTGFQVAQIQQDAAEARQNEILARVGSEKAFLEMLVLTGEIYPAYNLPAGNSKNP